VTNVRDSDDVTFVQTSTMGREAPVSYGPQIPPELLNNRGVGRGDSEDDGGDVGPKPDLENAPTTAGPTVFGPQIPTALLTRRSSRDDEGRDEDVHPPSYSPLPPPAAGPSKTPTRPSIGPSYPPTFNDDESDDSDDDIGPKPLPTGGMPSRETDGVREFMEKEERWRKLIEVHLTLPTLPWLVD
jgi:hypothetical protein